MIGALLSLFSGCSEKLAEPPKEPGMSLELRYPVLLVGERNLIVKNDEASLITTSVANGGVYYAIYTFIDSAGTEVCMDGHGNVAFQSISGDEIKRPHRFGTS
jgi:hypothetical protein